MGYNDDYERNQRHQRNQQQYGDDHYGQRQPSAFTPFGPQQGDFSSQDRDSGGWHRGQAHENHGRSKFTPSGTQQDFSGGRERGFDDRRYPGAQDHGPGGQYRGNTGYGNDYGNDYANDRESYGGTGRSEYSNDIGRGYERSDGGAANRGRASAFDRPYDTRTHDYGRSQHRDPDYHQWREEQIRALDNDYDTWRQERYSKFSDEFNTWRKSRQGLGPQDTQNMKSDADVAAGNRQIQAEPGAAKK